MPVLRLHQPVGEPALVMVVDVREARRAVRSRIVHGAVRFHLARQEVAHRFGPARVSARLDEPVDLACQVLLDRHRDAFHVPSGMTRSATVACVGRTQLHATGGAEAGGRPS